MFEEIGLLLNAPGIYRIYNKFNGKSYIGSSKVVRKRLYEHLRQLKSNKHHCIHLQRAFHKHTCNSFSVEILEYCLEEVLIEKEQYYLNLEQSFKRDKGYNLCSTAGRTTGVIISEQTREKLRNIKSAWLGRKHTPESLEKISKASSSRSNEVKQKISNSLKLYHKKKNYAN